MINKLIEQMENKRSILAEEIREADKLQKSNEVFNCLYAEYEKVVYTLNVLYSAIKEHRPTITDLINIVEKLTDKDQDRILKMIKKKLQINKRFEVV